MTTYNGQDFIREQLDSLLAQVGVSIHVYVFDDASTDGTISILRAYANRYPGLFTIFENSTNSGGTGVNIIRNAGRLPRHHDYVALADQDDVWLPGKLERAVEALSESGADLYFSDLLAWDGRVGLGIVRKAAPLKSRDHIFGGGSAGCTYVMSGSLFARFQEALVNCKLGNARRVSHDWIIYFFARHNGFKVCAVPEALIKYRIHSSSQYGGMSLGGLRAMNRKLRMLRAGFLREQIENALQLANEGTEDRSILLKCTKGRWERLLVLFKYRSSLARTKVRFILLVAALLISR